MHSPGQPAARLAAAFEDLAAQEEASLRAKDFVAVASIQLRAAAVVTALVARAAEVEPRVRARILAAQARRERTSAWLAGEIDETRQALRETDRSQRRVAQIAPVYGRGANVPHSHLHAVS